MKPVETGNIFLIGPMGSGKSSVGRHLAHILGRRFYDCDTEIERHTGVSIAVIFEYEGEAGFREREQRMLEKLTGKNGVVLATGGGAVLRETNREALRERGFVVYLRACIDELLRRTQRDTGRPLLQGVDRRVALERILAERSPLYEQVAHQIVDTGTKSLREVATELARTQAPTCSHPSCKH